MFEHRTRVVYAGLAEWAGECSCGWSGVPQNSLRSAGYDAHSHATFEESRGAIRETSLPKETE